MTTTVVVKANHGWPVDVTTLTPKLGDAGSTVRVEPDTERTFYVHSGADLHIHEVQPDEVAPSD
jgi:hypothetical protein